MRKYYEGKNLVSLILVFVLEFLLIFVNYLPVEKDFRRAAAYYTDPIVYSAGSGANSVKDFFSAVREFGSIRDEYNKLLIENAELKAENAEVEVMRKELDALERMEMLEATEEKFLRAEVVNKELYSNKTYLYINRGEDDGVKVGMPVIFGDIFVGFVESVERGSSKVKLPYTAESNIYVNVFNDEGEFAESIVSGTSSGLELNNVRANFDLKKGQDIIVTDERVGIHTVLGEVNSVNNDLTNAVKSGTVEPVLNYRDLKHVYVKL